MKFIRRELALGQRTAYETVYNPDLLFTLLRKVKRDEIDVPYPLPFQGFDLWNHYEVSWLNLRGKPMVGVAEIMYACDSPYMIESKSMKLYFNSLNNEIFANKSVLEGIIKNDLTQRVGAPVNVTITLLSAQQLLVSSFTGSCLDQLDIDFTTYQVDASSLQTENLEVTEVLYSDLLKSNCLVTQQPDWGSVQIAYQGKKINHEGLLRYIVSFRNHNEFHEQCIERMFMDIMRCCQPKTLAVYGRYTRRGGIDINPYRATHGAPVVVENTRLQRQ